MWHLTKCTLLIVMLGGLHASAQLAISGGGTGATTAAQAAANIVNGNAIQPSSVTNSNVNGVVSVSAYGAVGDFNASALTGCTIPASSTALSCTGAQATVAMVTKYVYLPGAGTSGEPLVTEISGYINSTSLTLSGMSITAVTSGEVAGVGTDNTTAIQNAINYCYTNYCAVFFPANPGTSSTAVYFAAETSSTINPKGVSMFGPPGAGGPANSSASGISVAVRGAPNFDVFAVGDASSYSTIPQAAPKVHDLGIIVDDSVNASSSFPNRLPGRTFWDAAYVNGSTTLSSSNGASFQPGDVGQNILVYGAGSGGSNLTTTIATYLSPNQVTLTHSAYVTNGSLTSITSATGGSVSGTSPQTCSLSNFNGFGSGATATATLTGSNTIVGATFAVTASGTGYSTITTATLGNGTATCSGTVTLVAVTADAQAYVSVDGLSVTQTIGNCAYTYDDSLPAGAGSPEGPVTGQFENVVISTVSGNTSGGQNYSCGFFFQGRHGPYQTLWSHDSISAEFPLVFATAPGSSTNPPSISYTNGIQDFNVFEHTWLVGNYSIIAYAGGFNNFRDIQISNAEYGPSLLTAYGEENTSPSNWYIDIPEIENYSSNCTTGWTSFRLAGNSNVVDRLGSQNCNPASSYMTLQMDANDTEVRHFFNATVGVINTTGQRTKIKQVSTNGGISGTSTTWNDTGYGNSYVTLRNANALNSIQPMRAQYAGGNSAGVGPATLAHDRTAFERTGDFLNKGASPYYLNDFDLWFWPHELGATGGAAPSVGVDSNSATGSAIQFTSGTSPAMILYESNGTQLKIGAQIPQGDLRIYFSGLAGLSSTSFVVDALYGTGSTPNMSLNCSLTLSLETSYPTSSVPFCDVNTSSLAVGDSFGIELGNGTMLSTNVSFAWIGIRVWDTGTVTTDLQIGLPNNNAITSNQGNGSMVQHSTGSPTSGDLASFDPNDNTVDSGLSFPTPSITATDLACAEAADTSIGSNNITAGTSTSLTGTSLPAAFYQAGTLVGVAGATSTGGTLNGGPYATSTIVTSGNVLTFVSGTLPGTWSSGGTIFLWCDNQSNDALSANPLEFNNAISVAGNTFGVTTNSYSIAAQMKHYMPASGTGPFFKLLYGTTGLSLSSSALPLGGTSTAGQIAEIDWHVTPLSTNLAYTSIQSFMGYYNGSTAFEELANGTPQPVGLTTTSNSHFYLEAYFPATGVVSATHVSGGTFTGTGTCTLGAFNNSSTATGTIAVSSGTPGAITITNRGQAATAQPTSVAQVNSCTGTAAWTAGAITITSVLGGAPGNAIQLFALTARP